ncbi:unnamed protein product [Adineta steineri]|uniref:Uncharacterized protein n=1 Tax=Adineta steineri TaxID=433720 RepID=A0A814Y9F6_9BILA|nr:unnamed protein product [Adineta steineri]CAF3736162.1 unnamed protein product [Adineta steineri]
MSEGELRVLLNKHKQMLNNTRLINALPDKGERLRNAINEIENYLIRPSSPMDCDILTNQFQEMTVSSNDIEEISQENVYLEKPVQNLNKKQFNNNFSDERLNEVKQRLKARQAQRNSKQTITKAKLISLDEAVRLYTEEKIHTEENLIQQTTARLLGNMSLTRTTFGPPPTTSKNDSTYRKTKNESDDEDNHGDELGREKAEIDSDHDSDEIDYPDEEVENDNN